MPRIKEIKLEEQQEEKQEETEEQQEKQEIDLDETLDDFVESEIQNPTIISADDIILQSGQAIPQVQITNLTQSAQENLETSLENVPTPEKDETKNTQYDKLYDENLDFYENKQKVNEPDRVVRVGRLMNPEAIINNPQERITDFNFRKVEMIRHSSQEVSRDNEMYEVGNLRPDKTQGAPSAQDDARLKKYKPRM